jgi:tellurite methyltransferase
MNFQNRFNQKYKDNKDTFGLEPLPIVKNAIKYVDRGNALDLGVGNGRNTIYLLSQSFKVTGVDSSEIGLKILMERVGNNPNLETVLCDVTKYQTDKKYNIILAIGLLHFLSKENGANLVNSMQEWTKPGGVNILGAKMVQNAMNDLPHTFEKNEIRKFYDKNDWEVREYQEVGGINPIVEFLIAQKVT